MAKIVSMEPLCKHTLIVHTKDRMSIADEEGQHHVAARRTDGIWNISADGVPDASTSDVHEAIVTMTDHMLAFKKATLGPEGFAQHMIDHNNEGREGFATFVPHEARKLDGKESHDDWKTSVGLHHLTY